MTSTQPFPTGPGSSVDISPARSRYSGSNDASFDISITSQDPTRTIAILMRSAAKVHRLAITSKITAAGFDILAERLETWETPADDDFLSAFLACEADEKKWVMRLTNTPIYVMLLERKRSAQAWLELLGTEDPHGQVDEDGLPLAHSNQTLRGTYGVENFYGSPVTGAEQQIAIAFPEYATSEALNNLGLKSPVDEHGVEYIDSHDVVYDEHGLAYDARTGEELDLQAAYDEDQEQDEHHADNQPIDRTGTVYRALRLPKSHLKPDIEPRLSKAAALRMGIELPKIPRAKRTSSDASSGSKSNQGPLGISGLPLADKPLPKSLSRPSLAPRLNKAAAARMGQGAAGEESHGANGNGNNEVLRPRQATDYSNTPGHKRNLIPSGLASLQKPTIAPRLNKASAARMSGGSVGANSPTTVLSPSFSSPGSLFRPSRTFSGSSATSAGSSESGPRPRQATDYSNTPGHKRMSVPGMSKVASLAAPSIAPRVNKASAARMGGGGPSGSSSAVAEGRKEGPDGRIHGRASSFSTGGSGIAAQREKVPVDYSNTPGHRRASLSLAVASLAPPTIAPRSNNAAEARFAADKVTRDGGEAGPRRPGSASGARPGSSNGSKSFSRPGSAMGAGSSPAQPTDGRNAKAKGAAPPSSYRMASGSAPVSVGVVPARPSSRA
ncbi:unnamed protein product [Tilletia controversa]|uniref:Nucleoside diphosphate kinase n=3 Tax=Tilletia TaxID=13289 RepID=A0A8X7SVU5_9BASI|nr:hypothetical protein CF336_g5707 [Tilletia laevis]KAE8193168.1 hypothetical protein CF328_g5129 [Tilletia controversa]KAE8256991.1 hypothetical protein A4X03_0g4857 [Tilletia caries]KAE8196596.1 hypothetical protein CF335_g4817 [Tilletia laevis]KAE8244943.1 hypothetical protein A4X06_0g5898 [Tilletia controversa]